MQRGGHQGWQHLRQDRTGDLLHAGRPGRPQRGTRAFVDLLDGVRVQLADHADGVDAEGHHARHAAQAEDPEGGDGEDDFGDGTAEHDHRAGDAPDGAVGSGVTRSQQGQRQTEDHREDSGADHNGQRLPDQGEQLAGRGEVQRKHAAGEVHRVACAVRQGGDVDLQGEEGPDPAPDTQQQGQTGAEAARGGAGQGASAALRPAGAGGGRGGAGLPVDGGHGRRGHSASLDAPAVPSSSRSPPGASAPTSE